METTDTAVFVYGTLRSGEGNYRIIRDFRHTLEPATFRGRMFSVYGEFGYPAVIPAVRGVVHGELVRFDGRDFPAALARLDQLEGYRGPGCRNHYNRELVDVETPVGVSKAWAFLWPTERLGDVRGRPIPGGDWVAHIKNMERKRNHAEFAQV